MKNVLFCTAVFAVFFVHAQPSIDKKQIEEKVNELMQELTLEEKASLCSGRDDWSSQPIERLNIPYIWMSDGPHGLRRAPATNKSGYGDQLPATCFPTASALAATWNTDLIYKVGQALGEECQAQDVNVLLGPGVNIKRSVLGGRNFEFFSEDPILSGEIGAAFINGVQSQGVGTSLKHYVANNVETWRMYMNSDLDKRTLHEIYLRPFEIAVKKAQPWTAMACYNRVQGQYGTQNPYILTDVLKKDWGFEGIVISDWFAVVDRVEGIKSGMHIEMPGMGTHNDSLIVEAVKNGSLDEEVLDNVVKEILFVVLRAQALEKEGVELDSIKHHAFARKVMGEAITLLKNDNNLLPLSKDKYKKIAIIGEFAANPRYQGNGSSEVKPTMLDAAIDIIKAEYGNGVKITYAQGYKLSDDNDFTLIEEAKKLAAESDIALVFAGLPLHYESEGIDRTHINMPASHDKLIAEVAAVQKNTVAVLTNGSAVAMPWVNDVPAILETWLGGQAGAGGVADVLFGKVNPSGKLAETFPAKLEDTPSFLNFPGEQGEVLYGERIFVGYRYYDAKKIEPLFPFGHGLSYTNFEFTDIQVSDASITDKDELTVTVKVKNTGSIAGKEVVQLYVSDTECLLQRPKKELKEFAKVDLASGEEKEVTFKLNARDFSYYDGRRGMWIAESGDFTIAAGASSRDIKKTAKVNLTSTQKVPVVFDEYTFFTAYWAHPESRKFLIEMIPNYLRGWTAEGKSLEEAKVMGFFADHPIIKFPYITRGEMTHAQVKELVEKCKELTFTP
ncbi:MAG: glycoside hydrolase family 3 C-terminal domain-containing protein [Salinivirgaceae bacterium]|jgi:beta-glucosidase|nr:glycoside hydrolase family 3 C-terminal domain-containing protein [Salinivirgaceae bacterium]